MERPTTSQGAVWMSSLALLLSFVAVGLLLLRGGSPTGDATYHPRTLDEVRATGELKAGYVVNIHQVNRDAKTGALSGYHYEVLSKIAADGGFEVKYEETTFSNMVAGLKTGQFDVVIGGGYESVARAREAAFSDPLMYISLGYVARADDERFKSETDLRRPGIKVAVTAGGASSDYLKMFLPKAQPVELTRSELSRIVLEVASGRADVGICNAANCLRFEQEHPNVKFVTKGKPMFLFSSGFVIRQGDPDWLHFLNSSIRQLQTNGFAQQLETKYNPQGIYWVPVKRP